MIAEIEYKGELRTEARHIRSGDVIYTDAPLDNQGKGEAFSPTDLTCASLGSCILTIMGIAARNHNINIEGAKAEVYKTMDSNPRRIQEIKIHIIMPAGSYSSREMKIIEKAAHHCPVALSLHPDTREIIEFSWMTR
ncbi:MAG: OsmC family protein [Saprospiraceae bacterium]|nr:OsmC family protein [Bacteroidia bacterium]MBT8229213.1 OsmC family protein [Bacteroidia bacterium]NNF22204.1 OsmC family protein [Saprospiraceae bacterium]